uniref:Uncharacterized protein n=1 Tax=Palpitomonas bilix TaxID=652834 RepID=A0A7S3GA61_9EUKA
MDMIGCTYCTSAAQLTCKCRADEREGSIPLFSSFSKDFVFRPPRLPRLDDVQKPKTPMTARGDKSEREKGMPRGDSFHISSARFSSPTLSGDFPSSTSNASSPPASARSRGPVSSTLERVARESASKKVNSDHIDRTLSRGRSLKRSESKLIHDMSDLPEGVQFYPRPPPAQTRASE